MDIIGVPPAYEILGRNDYIKRFWKCKVLFSKKIKKLVKWKILKMTGMGGPDSAHISRPKVSNIPARSIFYLSTSIKPFTVKVFQDSIIYKPNHL